MQLNIGSSIIEIIHDNIVHQDVDAIVNAANTSLLGGSGVDGSIHRAAGRELAEYCYGLNGCKTGDAKITPGFRLKARFVIHAVGPVYRGNSDAAKLLASTYRRSLEVASQHNIRTIAFPAISTGIYGYPLDEAAPIALDTVIEYVRQHPEIELVRFVLWTDEAMEAFSEYGAMLKSKEQRA